LPSLRDVRRRIRSFQNTQKITKAMQVVSATRLRRAQAAVKNSRPYAEKMVEVLQTTAERAQEYRHPYLERRDGGRALVIVVTADRGLCGALNANTLRAGDRPSVTAILPAVSAALHEYDEGRVDTVLLAYGRWVSTLRQEPEVETLLPIEIPEAEPGRTAADYIYEPGPEEVLDALLPRFIETQVYHAVLENQASFYSAQMIAMQNATNAAGDLIESLTLTANKIRQSAITTELMEIVSGAEALRKE